MQQQTLASIIDEMNVFRDIANIEDQYKEREIDNSIKKLRRKSVFPWMIKKTTLRVFKDVLEYPVASDHDEMFFLENQNIETYADTARFFNTSIKQFFQDVNSNRNVMAEIWKNGTKLIGVNDKDLGLESVNLDTADDADRYTPTDDATSVADELVVVKKGNSSVRVNIVNSSGVATIKNIYRNSIGDSNYTKKYYFRWIYLNSAPTSIDIRVQTDDSNYLAGNVTTQFSGSSFVANDWNQIVLDLNTATETGTFDSNTIASDKIILNGAATGTYYLDDADLKSWNLLDYWYYSTYNIIADGSTAPDQELFVRDGLVDTLDSLVGDKEWLAVVKYDAMNRLLADSENNVVRAVILRERNDAWTDFFAKYPDNIPLITTQKYRFENNPILTNLPPNV